MSMEILESEEFLMSPMIIAREQEHNIKLINLTLTEGEHLAVLEGKLYVNMIHDLIHKYLYAGIIITYSIQDKPGWNLP
jgi:hypothetical protein